MIIICAAITDADKCEIDNAYYINGLSTKYITDYCRKNCRYLIYISTDNNSNEAKGNCIENYVPYLLNYYGLIKLIWENYVNSYDNPLIRRTSGIC